MKVAVLGPLASRLGDGRLPGRRRARRRRPAIPTGDGRGAVAGAAAGRRAGAGRSHRRAARGRPAALHDRRSPTPFAMPTSSGSRSTRRWTTTIARTSSTSMRPGRRGVSAPGGRRARARVVAAAGRHDRHASSRRVQRSGARPHASASPARRRTCGSARPSRCSRIPTASSSACARATRSRARRGAASRRSPIASSGCRSNRRR